MGTGMSGDMTRGGYLSVLKVAGVGISALEVCPPLPSEKGSTREMDSKVVVRPETPHFWFSPSWGWSPDLNQRVH